MPYRQLPTIVVVDSSKVPEVEKVIFNFENNTCTALTMQRRDSKKNRKTSNPASSGGEVGSRPDSRTGTGSNSSEAKIRRNSTTVSSMKRKSATSPRSPKVQPNSKTSSFEVNEEGGGGGLGSNLGSGILSNGSSNQGSPRTGNSSHELDKIEEGKSVRITVPDDHKHEEETMETEVQDSKGGEGEEAALPVSGDTEDDVMAQLNASLAKEIEREKLKKIKLKKAVEQKNRESAALLSATPMNADDSDDDGPMILNSNLLKPTHIPEHVKNRTSEKKSAASKEAAEANKTNNKSKPEPSGKDQTKGQEDSSGNNKDAVTKEKSEKPEEATKTQAESKEDKTAPDVGKDENQTDPGLAKNESSTNLEEKSGGGGGKKAKDQRRRLRFMISPELRSKMSKKEIERALKLIVIDAFRTAGERKERMKNKWFRWKYVDDLVDDKEMAWLKSNGVDDLGWAVGRRIYEKEEIEKVDEKFKLKEKSALFEARNISLKDAPSVFGLWDKVYHTNAVKTLDGQTRWDPTKSLKDLKASQKRQRIKNGEVSESSDSESDSDESSGEGDEEDGEDGSGGSDNAEEASEEEDSNAEDVYDDEGNKIKKKKKRKKSKKSKKKKDAKNNNKSNKGQGSQNDKDVLKNEDLQFLKVKTSFSEEEILRWHANFLEECPSGKLSKAHLQRLFKKLSPFGDSEHFCSYIFRLFDADQNNVLEFKEFLQAIDVVTRKSEDERLKWAFRLYDTDNSGKINVKEMASVIDVLQGLEGKVESSNNDNSTNTNKKSATFVFAEKVFKLMDDDNDGEINVEEFVKGYQKLRARQNSQAVTVTAYVHAKPKEKQRPRGDPIKEAGGVDETGKEDSAKTTVGGRSRRKSLRDGSKVKSLFKNEDRI